MQSSAMTNSGRVRPGEGSIAETIDPGHVADVLSYLKNNKFVLPALKRIMDAILLQAAVEINYSSIHPHHLIQNGTRGEEHPLTDEDVLVGGCCYPHMDCVGSAYFIHHKIITILKQFDETSILKFEVSLIVAMSKFEESLQMLCLHRVDKKAVDGFAPAEHMAVKMSMNNWHLLMDVGKTVLSILLAPGEEADSIPMIRLVVLRLFTILVLMPFS